MSKVVLFAPAMFVLMLATFPKEILRTTDSGCQTGLAEARVKVKFPWDNVGEHPARGGRSTIVRFGDGEHGVILGLCGEVAD